MRLVVAAFSVLSMFGLDPCGGGGDGGNGNAGGGGGTTTPPAQNGDVAGADGAPCRFFHNGWEYRTMTSYEPGHDPIVGDVSGDASFAEDGTFTEDYTIGDIANDYKGTYTIANGVLHTHDPDSGDSDAKVACSDDTFEMVLTYTYPDGSPQIIAGLHSKLDPANTNGK